MGAAFLESGDVVKAYEGESEVAHLIQKMGHVLDGELRLTQKKYNFMNSPSHLLLGELNKAILENSISDYLTEETAQKWFDEYKKNHKNAKGKKKKFNQVFQEIIELMKKVPQEETARIIAAFAYLISRDGKDLAAYAKGVGVEIEPQQFTDQELSDLTNDIDQIIAATLISKKNKTFDFLHMRHLRASFDGKEEVAICGEDALWTVVNFMLYNEKTDRLDLELLSKKREVLPAFKTFIETYSNPRVPRYSELAKQSWMNLVSNVPGVVYIKGNYALESNEQNALKLLNYLFDTSANSFEDFGKLVSSERRAIAMSLIIEPESELVSKKIYVKVLIKNSIDSVLDWQFSPDHVWISIDRKIKVDEKVFSMEFLEIIERLKKRYPLISLEALVPPSFANLLINAVEDNDQDLIHRLLSLNIDINAKVGFAMPLHHAVNSDNVKIVQFLLERGAIVDVFDHNGSTPLQWALDNENLEIGELLLKYGANPNLTMELRMPIAEGY